MAAGQRLVIAPQETVRHAVTEIGLTHRARIAPRETVRLAVTEIGLRGVVAHPSNLVGAADRRAGLGPLAVASLMVADRLAGHARLGESPEQG